VTGSEHELAKLLHQALHAEGHSAAGVLNLALETILAFSYFIYLGHMLIMRVIDLLARGLTAVSRGISKWYASRHLLYQPAAFEMVRERPGRTTAFKQWVIFGFLLLACPITLIAK
jgi:hypothetical protein